MGVALFAVQYTSSSSPSAPPAKDGFVGCDRDRGLLFPPPDDEEDEEDEEEEEDGAAASSDDAELYCDPDIDPVRCRAFSFNLSFASVNLPFVLAQRDFLPAGFSGSARSAAAGAAGPPLLSTTPPLFEAGPPAAGKEWVGGAGGSGETWLWPLCLSFAGLSFEADRGRPPAGVCIFSFDMPAYLVLH